MNKLQDTAAAFTVGTTTDVLTSGGSNMLLVTLVTILTPFIKDFLIYLSKKIFTKNA